MAPDSDKLRADLNKSSGERVRIPCPLNPQHLGLSIQKPPLYLEVKHNLRTEVMIWAWGVAIHNELANRFKEEGFTGYRLRPAIVRFRDGAASSDYQELVVTGWAGAASPLSGMKLIESCPACHYRRYSAVEDYDNIVDWQQWTGGDFFYVYQFLGLRLCTERVAEFLNQNKVRSFRIEEGFNDRKNDSLISKLSVPVGSLINFLPEDLAAQYGKPLGLE